MLVLLPVFHRNQITSLLCLTPFVGYPETLDGGRMIWKNYSEAKFKTFRISRSTFRYRLNRIGPFLAGESMTEELVSPELGLALCLYRLGRGDYLYTNAPQTSIFCVEQDCSSFPAIFFEYNLLRMTTT